MRKSSILAGVIILFLLVSGILIASEPTQYLAFFEASTNYTKAIREKKSPQEILTLKKKMLAEAEKYIKKYEDKVPKNTVAVLGSLVLSYYQDKNVNKVIYYGEKLAKKSGLNDMQKASLFLYMADSYIASKKDLKRGAEYADGVILLAKNNIETSTGALKRKWQILLSQALYMKANVAYIQKDYANALKNYEEAYNYFPSSRTLKKIRDIGKLYYVKKDYKNAIKTFEFAYEKMKAKHSKRVDECLKLMAKTYVKLGQRGKALSTYLKLYSMRKNAEIAYKIGVEYNKKFKASGGKDKSFLEKAKQYWAEAVVLKSPKIYAAQAEKVLKNYMINMEKASLQDYEDLLKVAKKRLGLLTP